MSMFSPLVSGLKNLKPEEIKSLLKLSQNKDDRILTLQNIAIAQENESNAKGLPLLQKKTGLCYKTLLKTLSPCSPPDKRILGKILCTLGLDADSIILFG